MIEQTDNQAIERSEFIAREKCPRCTGLGFVDTGGVYPWGASIIDGCPDCKGSGVIHWCESCHGYGTPCGDGLKAVYDAWRDLVAAAPPVAVSQS